MSTQQVASLSRQVKEQGLELDRLRAYAARLELALQDITLGECRCRDVASRALLSRSA